MGKSSRRTVEKTSTAIASGVRIVDFCIPLVLAQSVHLSRCRAGRYGTRDGSR